MVSSFWPSIGIYGVGVAGGSGFGGDPWWNLTDICCNFGGTDGSTTITEEKSGNTFTSIQAFTPAGYGLPVISTAQSVSGGSSLKFVDGAWTKIALPNVGINQDFTLEWWEWWGTHPGNSTTQIGQIGYSAVGTANNNPRITYASNGTCSGLPMTAVSPGGGWAAGSWHHVAVVGLGKSGRFYRDGQIVGYGYNSTATAFYNTQTYQDLMMLGNNNGGGVAPSSNACLKGTYIDSLRYTRGVARYCGPYTPPAMSLPTSSYGTITEIDYSLTEVLTYAGGGINIGGFWDDSETTGGRTQSDTINPKFFVFDLGFYPLISEIRIMNGNGNVQGTTNSSFNSSAFQQTTISYNLWSSNYGDSRWVTVAHLRDCNYQSPNALTQYRWIRLLINGGLGVQARYWMINTNVTNNSARFAVSGMRFYAVMP